jgi:hypothetical protein
VSARPFVNPMTELTSPARQVAVVMCVFYVLACLPADTILPRFVDTVHFGLALHSVYWYTVTTDDEGFKSGFLVWCEDMISRTCCHALTDDSGA